ncbi:MAG: hypothetical protein AAF598_08170, partial [Bacteroidota bacterium]
MSNYLNDSKTNKQAGHKRTFYLILLFVLGGFPTLFAQDQPVSESRDTTYTASPLIESPIQNEATNLPKQTGSQVDASSVLPADQDDDLPKTSYGINLVFQFGGESKLTL